MSSPAAPWAPSLPFCTSAQSLESWTGSGVWAWCAEGWHGGPVGSLVCVGGTQVWDLAMPVPFWLCMSGVAGLEHRLGAQLGGQWRQCCSSPDARPLPPAGRGQPGLRWHSAHSCGALHTLSTLGRASSWGQWRHLRRTVHDDAPWLHCRISLRSKLASAWIYPDCSPVGTTESGMSLFCCPLTLKHEEQGICPLGSHCL